MEQQKGSKALMNQGVHMKPDNTHKLILAGFILLSVLACNALVPVPIATPSPMPATLTSTPPSQGFVISTLHFNETGQNSEYTINAQFPAILETTDAYAQAFNDAIETLVHGEIDAFKKGIAELPAEPASTASSFDVTYNVLFQSADIASIKFVVVGYTSGAAHPYHYTITVNYDFEQSRSLLLDELFLPGSNYLEPISNYCFAELSKQPGFEGPWQEGAAPTPENYRNWNITPDGLMITFDEYQVAPYASGPQTVIVPYRELQAVMDPQAPPGGFIK